LIAAHRAAGGRVVVATHQPIAIEAAETVAIGDYTPAAAAA
jgi:ABC-type transport system involved in cytochrome c biogenesis ATPase subunit